MLERGPGSFVLVRGDATVSYVSPWAARVLAGRGPLLVDAALTDIAHADDRPALEAWLGELIRADPGRSLRVEVRLDDDRVRHVELIGVNLLTEPDVGAVVITSWDTTEQRLREHDLVFRALHEPLTGLANRALLFDRLDQSLRRGEGTALIAVDLDAFKAVNDRYGHMAGDEILRLVADRLAVAVPASATLGRVGGDEFLVVLPGAPAAVAADLAERLVASVRTPFETESGTISLTACAGSASCPGQGSSAELARWADVALYAAKTAGRDRAVRHDPQAQPSEPADSEALRALRAETEALKKLVITDELTGIPNLRRYRERLAGLDLVARERGEPYSLAFCDIDSFGSYNKRFGEAQGDETLRAIATTILARLRSGDEVYRRGGEELVVLLPGTGQAIAASVAERIRRAVEDLGIRRGPATAAGIVTVSIGVATFDPAAPVDPGDVEAAADRAMLAAKQAGKNRVRTAGRDRRDPGGERPEPPSSD